MRADILEIFKEWLELASYFCLGAFILIFMSIYYNDDNDTKEKRLNVQFQTEQKNKRYEGLFLIQKGIFLVAIGVAVVSTIIYLCQKL